MNPSTSFEDVYHVQTAEITRLRAEVEALKKERAAAEIVHRETATTVLMQMAEVQRLRDALRVILEADWTSDRIRNIARKALEGGE